MCNDVYHKSHVCFLRRTLLTWDFQKLKAPLEICTLWTLQDLLLLQHVCWDKEPSQATEVRVWLLDRMRRFPEAMGPPWIFWCPANREISKKTHEIHWSKSLTNDFRKKNMDQHLSHFRKKEPPDSPWGVLFLAVCWSTEIQNVTGRWWQQRHLREGAVSPQRRAPAAAPHTTCQWDVVGGQNRPTGDGRGVAGSSQGKVEASGHAEADVSGDLILVL